MVTTLLDIYLEFECLLANEYLYSKGQIIILTRYKQLLGANVEAIDSIRDSRQCEAFYAFALLSAVTTVSEAGAPLSKLEDN
jgi:hypothetical protein